MPMFITYIITCNLIKNVDKMLYLKNYTKHNYFKENENKNLNLLTYFKKYINTNNITNNNNSINMINTKDNIFLLIISNSLLNEDKTLDKIYYQKFIYDFILFDP
jgi:hypothetical protein